MYLSRALGDIWSLPNKNCVFGHGTEVKNVVSLQMERIITEPGQVNSLVSINRGEDILFCGIKGVYVLSSETAKKKKKSVTTLSRLESAVFGDKVPQKLIKLSDKQLLLQMTGIKRDEVESVCFDLSDLKRTDNLRYTVNSSPLTAACPTNDGNVIVARESGEIQVYSSEIDVELSAKLGDVVIELQQGPVSGLYFAGMKSGTMAALSIDEKGITVLSRTRLFRSSFSIYLLISWYLR